MTAHSASRATTLDAVVPSMGEALPHGALASDDLDPAALAAAKPVYETCQRLMDLFLGLAAAICFLPVGLLAALVLATTVGGPLLLREQRVGRHGRVFEVLRFRTLSAGMRRRTGLARLVYLARLDELPQIVNVLRGDMSVVGPRPETPASVASLTGRLRGYELRHLVKPGLTGWSQAMGHWTDGDDAARLSCDLFYVANRGLALDLRILQRTAALVLGGAAGRAA